MPIPWRSLWGILVHGLALVALAVPAPAQGQDDLSVTPARLEAALASITRQVTNAQASGSAPLVVAVFEFADLAGCRSGLGRYLAEALVTRVKNTERFTMVERTLLYQTLSELRINVKELFDPAQAQRFRKYIGANAILAGVYADGGATLTLYVRLIDVEAGKILIAASAEVTKDARLAHLLAQSVTCSGGDKLLAPETERGREPALDRSAVPAVQTVYQAEPYRIRITDVVKSDESVTIVALLENRLKRPYKLELAMADGEMYLLDSRGHRWELDRRSVGGMSVELFAIWFTGRVELIPDAPAKVAWSFRTGGDSDSSTFSLIATEGMGGSGGAGSPALFGHGRRIIIKGLKAHPESR
jgi:curli biogenesis system outer membrane secretion channel CsgG